MRPSSKAITLEDRNKNQTKMDPRRFSPQQRSNDDLESAVFAGPESTNSPDRIRASRFCGYDMVKGETELVGPPKPKLFEKAQENE
jgi:hypothetical protein